ncbi:MAG: N-formylglutamate amidohydrolase [Alphaproteobacteria bacterium]|nr:N-formylglutamate amidohydrolase [Alphaproteobacteria bacterium]
MPGRQPPVGGPESRPAVVLTCEHASCEAPPGWSVDPATLASHAGWDAGAAEVARALGDALGVEPFMGRFTRLFVDLNRSADHPGVVPVTTFGFEVPANAGLGAEAVEARLAGSWRPFRDAVRAAVAAGIAARGAVVHLSVHSFSAELDPARTYPVGVLFDPARAAEVRVAGAIREVLRLRGHDVRQNEPYLGVDDGHTTGLRRVFGDPAYAGLELELNQRFLGTPVWDGLVADLVEAVRESV